jgi:hypothetical protein
MTVAIVVHDRCNRRFRFRRWALGTMAAPRPKKAPRAQRRSARRSPRPRPETSATGRARRAAPGAPVGRAEAKRAGARKFLILLDSALSRLSSLYEGWGSESSGQLSYL